MKPKTAFSPRSFALALEQRILFDGAAAIDVVDHAQEQEAALAADRQAEHRLTEGVLPAGEAPPPVAPASSEILLVVDARVADYASLVAQLPPNVALLVIDPAQSGIAAVDNALAELSQVQSVQIISHGETGSFSLGSDRVDAQLLRSRGAQIAAWGAHLSAEADILLYGCDIAHGETGGKFIAQLAALTGADIAASTNATGATAQGGDWSLEAATGPIESRQALDLAAREAWRGRLDVNTPPIPNPTEKPPIVASEKSLLIDPAQSNFSLDGYWNIATGYDKNIVVVVGLTNNSEGKAGRIVSQNSAGSAGSFDNVSGLKFTGTVSAAQAWLNQLAYEAPDEMGNESPQSQLKVRVSYEDRPTMYWTRSGPTVSLTPANDPAEVKSDQRTLTVNEGASATPLQWAVSDPELSAVPPTQSADQVVYTLKALSTHGYLKLDGVRLGVGSSFTQADVNSGKLTYTHTDTSATQNDPDSFRVTVNDGATPFTRPGGVTGGYYSDDHPVDFTIRITPVNQAPSVSASVKVYENQPLNAQSPLTSAIGEAIVVNSGGDPGDNDLSLKITSLPQWGELHYSGEATINGVSQTLLNHKLTVSDLTAGFVIKAADKAGLRYAHTDTAEPTVPGHDTDSFNLSVTDNGGGTATSQTVPGTVSIQILPVDDDPVLAPNSTLTATVHSDTSTVVLQNPENGNPLLKSTDVDTPASAITYRLTNIPLYGQLMRGNEVLSQGGVFTQADIDSGLVRYQQTTKTSELPPESNKSDKFEFVVVDNTQALRWDAQGQGSDRVGGIYDSGTGELMNHTFTLKLAESVENPPANSTNIASPIPAPTPDGDAILHAGIKLTDVKTNAVSIAEGGSGTVLGMDADPNTKIMLRYTANYLVNGEQKEVAPEAIIYTILEVPANGSLSKSGRSIGKYDSFTQADLDSGKISFTHNGGEVFESAMTFSVCAGGEAIVGTFGFFIQPVNDAPSVTGQQHILMPEGSTTVIDTSMLSFSDADDAGGPGTGTAYEKYLENSATATGDNRFALNHDTSGTNSETALKFQIDSLPQHGRLEYKNESNQWVVVTTSDLADSSSPLSFDSRWITADSNASRLRYTHDGSENATDQFTIKAIDRTGAASAAAATVSFDITPVNDPPEIAQTPNAANPGTAESNRIGAGVNGVGASQNDPLTVVEGARQQITPALLQAWDPDNAATQVQYRITGLPQHGKVMRFDGVSAYAEIGVGGSFTQQEIADGKIFYQHDGTETDGKTTVNSPGQSYDKFTFALSDGAGVQEGREFWIYAEPANDAPKVVSPKFQGETDKFFKIESSGTAVDIRGFTLSDSDLKEVVAGETDYVQAVVRVLKKDGTPLTAAEYKQSGGYGITLAATASGSAAVSGGSNEILYLRGSLAEVQATLDMLSIQVNGTALALTGADDQYLRLQVLLDDRLRDSAGALIDANAVASGTQAAANGGKLNQDKQLFGETEVSLTPEMPSGEPNYYSDTTAALLGSNVSPGTFKGNLGAASVNLRISLVNAEATVSAPDAVTVNEDIRTQIAGDFVINDPESNNLDSNVRVTLSVTHGQLDLGAAGAQGSFVPSGGDPEADTVSVTGDGTGTLVLVGRAAAIQALLNGKNIGGSAADSAGGLYYQSALDDNADHNDAAAGDVTLTLTFDEDESAIGSVAGGGSKNANIERTTAITLTALNDKPEISGPVGPLSVLGGDTTPTSITGLVLSDAKDFIGGTNTGETDGTVQLMVRLLDSNGNLLTTTDYQSIGAVFAYQTSSGAVADTTSNGTNAPLVLRGTLAQLKTALAGLSVQFGSDANASYTLEVLFDDRLRDGAGALAGGANGGLHNQGESAPDNVPSTDVNPLTTTTDAVNIFNIARYSRELRVSSSNDAPINELPASFSVSEDSAAILVKDATGQFIEISDADDFGANLTVKLTAANGTLAIGENAGVTGDNTSGQTTLTLTGNKTALNAVLQTLKFTPTPNLHGVTGIASISIETTDTALSGLTADNKIDSDRLDIEITPVNDRPTASNNVTLAATDEATASTGSTFASLDFGYSDATDDQSSHSNTTTNVAGSDTKTNFSYLAIIGNAAIAGQGTWQVLKDGGNATTPGDWIDLPASGLSETTALIFKASQQVRFVPNGDFFGTPGKLTVRLADASVDLTGQVSASASEYRNLTTPENGSSRVATGAWNAVDRTIGLTVNNINDRPTASGDARLDATSEDAPNPAGKTVNNLFGSLYRDSKDDQTSIGGGNEASSFGGIAIVDNAANPATEGVWQYFASGAWVTIGTPSDAAAILLPTEAQLRFLPNVANYNGTPGALTVRLADSTQTFSASQDIRSHLGETDTWSATTLLLSTSVTAVNDAPTLTHSASNPTFTEVVGTPVPVNLLGSGSLADPDLGTGGLDADIFGAGTVTVQLTDGAAAGDVLSLAGLSAGANGIASITGGTNREQLVIGFTQTATKAQVEAALAAIQFQNTGNNPDNFGNNRTRSYSITLNDGSNQQTAGNAGSPALAATAITGTITVTALNDPPVAVNDSATITEDASGPVSGNLITNDSDPDTAKADLRVTQLGGTAVAPAGSTIITGQYGTLTIQPDGSYSYVLDNSNPAVNALKDGQTLTESFDYTLSDGALIDTARLNITIQGRTDGAPTIGGHDDNGADSGHATVAEKGLVDHDSSQIVSGSIDLSAPDGLLKVKVGDRELTLADLKALASNPVDITTNHGTLRLTGLNVLAGSNDAPTSATLTYTYTLTAAQQQPGATEGVEQIALQITDKSSSGTPVNGELQIRIIDDTPRAENDNDEVINEPDTPSSTATGNVFTGSDRASASGNDANSTDGRADRIGADGPGSAESYLTHVGKGASNPMTAVNAGSSSTSDATSVVGDYGTLLIGANGDYVYTPDYGNSAVQALDPFSTLNETFTYRIADQDGDTSDAQLTIQIFAIPNILGLGDGAIAGTDGTVKESDLPSGSNPVGDGETLNGSFQVITRDSTGNWTLTIGGTLITAQELSNLGSNPITIDTGKGSLQITGYEDDGSAIHTHTIRYTYTLNAPQTHSGLLTDDIAVKISTATQGDVNKVLQIAIEDDAPVANADTGALAENETLSGNLVTGVNATADSLGADGATVTGVAAGVQIGEQSGNIGTGVAGDYGTLTVAADGSYTYVPNAAALALKEGETGTDTFTYTLKDADGSWSTTTLVLSVQGKPTPPDAIDDTTTITEDASGPVSGNLITNDSDPDTAKADLRVTQVGGTAVAPAGSTITGLYGTLTIQPDGSYSYVLDNSNPAVNALKDGQTLTESFAYTLSDGALTDTASLNITIQGRTDGAPTIGGHDDNGAASGHATVAEKGLVDKDSSQIVSGSIDLSAPDGLLKVTVGGRVVTLAELKALASNPVEITTSHGTLRLTGLNVPAGSNQDAPASATLAYTYTLTAAQQQPNATEGVERIALQITDRSSSGTTAAGELQIRIIDDTPRAENDNDEVINQPGTPSSTATGNVFTGSDRSGASDNDANSTDGRADRIGADGPGSAGSYLTHVGKGASKPTAAVAAGSSSTSNAATVAGDYGTLKIGANGDYVYTPNYEHPAVKALDFSATLSETFTYRITDKDGDTSDATLTIRISAASVIQGLNDGSYPGTDGTVKESDLPGGSSPAGNGETLNGSFRMIVRDNPQDWSSFSIGGRNITPAELAALSSGKTVTIDTGKGTLVLTGHTLSDHTHTISYTYTLNGPQQHVGLLTDDIPVRLVSPMYGAVTATLKIAIEDDAPTANPDTATLREDETLRGNLVTGVNATADSLGADGATVSGVAAGAQSGEQRGNVGTGVEGIYGTLTVAADGSYTYVPNAAALALKEGESGTDTFTYTLRDADGSWSTTTLVLSVQGVPTGVGGGELPVPPDGAGPLTPPLAGPGVRPDETGLPASQLPGTSLGGIRGLTLLQLGGSLQDPSPLPIASTFIDGQGVFGLDSNFDAVRRLPLPFHPIVYVNRAVEQAQQARVNDDLRGQGGDPRILLSGDAGLSSQNADLGMDPNLFVQHAVRDVQGTLRESDGRVRMREGVISLSSDAALPGVRLFDDQPDGWLVDLLKLRVRGAGVDSAENSDEADSDDAPNTGTTSATPKAQAPSFSAQLQRAAQQRQTSAGVVRR